MLFENISKLCGEKKISISGLERKLGLGNATIRGWSKSSPTVDKLQRVANYFNVTIDDLLKDV